LTEASGGGNEESIAVKVSSPPKAKKKASQAAEDSAISSPPKINARSSKEKAATIRSAEKVRRPPKQIKAKVKVPKPAKRDVDTFRKSPPNPMIAFINEKRNEIAAMPGVSGLGQITKKGAELFKALDPEEREERQKRFVEEVKAYKEWQSTDEGKAAMIVIAQERAAKKSRRRKKLGIGAFAMGTAEKRKVSKPSTPTKKRKARGSFTPPKMPRLIRTKQEKEQEAEKQRKKKELELRIQVLGARNPRERALAIMQEALHTGKINPSWNRRSPKSKSEQPADEAMFAEAFLGA